MPQPLERIDVLSVDADLDRSIGIAGASTLIIACGALARELFDVIRLNGWSHLAVTCLPAKLHNRPEKITEAVRAKIRANRDKYDRILCLYGDCGTGGTLDAMLHEEGVERIEGTHCYAFYAGLEEFDAMMDEEVGTFFLTDYIVRQFDALIIKGLGLDRYPQLFNDYFGHYRRVVWLAQAPDAELEQKAHAAAAKLGLPLVISTTGLAGMETFLKKQNLH
ncbi:DUF1638 domain-containing protein [Methylovirgula sp. 4M-Z18]|uniref:DUF1638 domain-containing protein n=1 Tax=Methylovirgula sp. 4M-Z18 TaxID=2293567 RepID=UPI000E2FDDA7|nr:DUF1638 domain-containing protein [Methylovirgula sp. 4M-Z18]RFB79244.1 DUF1638 domain-containing protein [Methylovirgula sp. 4M-Z18]